MNTKTEMYADRLFFADLLRAIATIGVITIHVASPLHQNEALYEPKFWLISNIWICSTTWSVPMFVMLSGMLHLRQNKQYSTGSFIQKLLAKILIPLSFWSFLYEIYHRTVIQKESVGFTDIMYILKDLYEGKSTYHLWFLYLIVGLYLFTPILRAYIRQVDYKEVSYLLWVWLIVSVIDMTDTFAGIKNGFYLQYVSGYIGYYVLGYYLSLAKFKRNTTKVLAYGGIISVLTLIILSYMLKTNNYYNWYSLCNNLSIFTIINSVTIFVFFKEIDWSCYLNNNFGLLFKEYVEDFSSNSFGIYLIHIFVLGAISSRKFPVKLNAEFVDPVIGIPITIIFATAISHLLIRYLKKLRYLKAVIP